MKKRLQCICIDDSTDAQENLTDSINKFFPNELMLIQCFDNSYQAYSYLEKHLNEIDIVFMDIRLGGPNEEEGYTFVEQLQKDPLLPYVIFYSGTINKKHFSGSHKFSKVIGFITKPEDISDDNAFVSIMSSVLEKIKEKQVAKTLFKLKNEDILIENNKIMYIKTMKKIEAMELGLNHNENKVVYLSEKGERSTIYSRTTIKELAQILIKPNFYLISDACIVNYQYIKGIFRKTLESDGGVKLTINDEKVYSKENSPAWKDFLEYWNNQKTKK